MSESTKNMTEQKKLKFDRIDISFIYGYVNYNLRKSDVNKDDIKGFDEMWAPIYNLNRCDDGFCIQSLTKNKVKIENESISITSNSKDESIDANISASILRKIDNKDSIQKGGPGCVIIKISVKRSAEENYFDINKIFKILELIPRKSKDSEFRKKIKFINEEINSQEAEKLKKFSPIFRLFYELLRENQECWNELYKVADCPDQCENCNEYHPFYDENSDTDPQIPYIIVEGYLPKDNYYRDFIIDNEGKDENVKKHSKYTNEIGCLLGRWLNTGNINQLNTDYYCYYTDNDEELEKRTVPLLADIETKKVLSFFLRF